MVEPEWTFAGIDDVMDVAEGLLTTIVSRVLERCAGDLTVLGRDPEPLRHVVSPFPRVSYTDALTLLKDKGLPLTWGEDFGAPHETAISESFDRPVFVHRYPARVRAFYMRPDPLNPEVALGVDCLAPEGYGEIVGGGERLADRALLESRIAEHGLPREAFEWYLDLRRYGSVPHAGFGMGIERVVGWMCGLEHLREAIPFPRTLSRIYP